MAYLGEIVRPKCWTCGAQASQTVYSNRNDRLADYCKAHAGAALADRVRYEQAQIERQREEKAHRVPADG